MNSALIVNKQHNDPKQLYKMFCADTTKVYHDYKKQHLTELVTKITDILDILHLKPTYPLLDDLLDNTKAHFSSVVESNNKGTKYFIKIILKEDTLMKKMVLDNQILGDVLKKNKDIELRLYTPELVESDVNFLLYEFVQGKSIGSRYNDSSIIKKAENDQIVSILKSLLSFDLRLISTDLESYDKDFFLFYIEHNSYLKTNKNIYKEYINDKTLSVIEKISSDKNILNLIDNNTHFLTHNDFRPANMINADGMIKIIDWDLYGQGVKFHDVARFYNFYYSDQTIQKGYLNTWLNDRGTTDEQILFYTWLVLESFHETNMVLHRLNENISKKNLRIIKSNFYKRIDKLIIFTDTLNRLLY